MIRSRLNLQERKRSRKNRSKPILFFSLIFIVLIFFLNNIDLGKKNNLDIKKEETSAAKTSGGIDSLKNKIRKETKNETVLLEEIKNTLASTPGTYGIYINELETGKSFGINEEMSFYAASTVKIPLLMALYKDISTGKVSKDDVMTYTKSDDETGTGSIQYTNFGTKWTVAELAKKMMKQSDNVAKNMIFRLVGHKRAQEYINSLGVTTVDMSMENTTTPKDAGTLLKLIYENKTVNKELSDEMINLMVKTDFEKRLPRYLSDVKVSHKIGTWSGAISDTGIVFLDGNPYTISVYSKGIQNVEDAEEIIGTISKKVYDFESSN